MRFAHDAVDQFLYARDVAGAYPRIMKEGKLDSGPWSCGMVAGLIHDIPSVKELIDRIMREAHQIISERLARFESATH